MSSLVIGFIWFMMAIDLTQGTLNITSSAFTSNGMIPAKYTCQGENVNPPIRIGNIPAGTNSLTLIMDDPDAPGETFDHWIVWNIEPKELIPENSIPGTEGKNHYGILHYKGPCPPSGTHRYFFKVYALDQLLDLKEGADKKTVEKAMEKHVLASGELIGTYKKK
jgi:Raf kinase inhibitor-like YbhB/YbcL family protein